MALPQPKLIDGHRRAELDGAGRVEILEASHDPLSHVANRTETDDGRRAVGRRIGQVMSGWVSTTRRVCGRGP
jgi:hypothetical protein